MDLSNKSKLSYLGFIIHIGLYSYYGFDDIESFKKRRTKTGSEFYLKRLLDNEPGSKETKIHHHNYGDNFDYFKAPFEINKQKIEEWLDICVSCRASYVILTIKNFDGFCLWNTNTTNKKSNIDLLLIFKNECKKRGLQFGVYFTWYEFSQSFSIEYFNNIVYPQILEIIQYQPDIIWFDGDSKIIQKSIKDMIRQIIIYIYSLRQYGINILINDRICQENIDCAGFRTYENYYIPSTYTTNWQHINTIGLSWGYNKCQKKEHFKTGSELYNIIRNVYNLGGVTCFNIAPSFDGTIDSNEIESLHELSNLLNF